uniref:BPTI/Kunitz inhibitor domain-containing protein n=1 Tax=Oryzias latipes TaxID=8090 RepID=H2M3H0_ORYLA
MVGIKRKGGHRINYFFSLSGRTMTVRPTVLEDFKTLVKEQQLGEDNIIIKEDKEYIKKISDLVSLPSASTGVCAQAPDSGLCFGYFERYFYNFRKGRCEIFIYGGCLGNQNNFLTEKECLQRWVCAQAPDSGLCFGYFERYFYNFRKGRCEIFIYGGCLGNQNNFLTEKECLQRCLPY